jgi:hypothetical protein
MIDFVATGEPRSVHYCHCSLCRRATGGPFAVIAWFRESDVAWKPYRPAAYGSSKLASRSFCPHCGTPICLQYHESAEIGFMVGCLDEPERFVPAYRYAVEGRLSWCDAGSALTDQRVTREKLD